MDLLNSLVVERMLVEAATSSRHRLAPRRCEKNSRGRSRPGHHRAMAPAPGAVGLWLGDTEDKTFLTPPLGQPRRPGRHRVRGWAARAVASEIQAEHPPASASFRDALDDMFTVRRLGVSGTLSTHQDRHNQPTASSRPTRSPGVPAVAGPSRKDGKRWISAGILEAEHSLRRVLSSRVLTSWAMLSNARRDGLLSHPENSIRHQPRRARRIRPGVPATMRDFARIVAE